MTGAKLYRPLFYNQPLTTNISVRMRQELDKAQLNNMEEKKLMMVFEDLVYALLSTKEEEIDVRVRLLMISIKRRGFTYNDMVLNDSMNPIRSFFNLLVSFNQGNKEVIQYITESIKIDQTFGTYDFNWNRWRT